MNGSVTVGAVVNATMRAVDAAATQGAGPAPINATQLNGNLIALGRPAPAHCHRPRLA